MSGPEPTPFPGILHLVLQNWPPKDTDGRGGITSGRGNAGHAGEQDEGGDRLDTGWVASVGDGETKWLVQPTVARKTTTKCVTNGQHISTAGVKRASATASSSGNADDDGVASSSNGSVQKRLRKGPLELTTEKSTNQVEPTSEQQMQRATAASTGGKRKSPPEALDVPAKKKVRGEQRVSGTSAAMNAASMPAPTTKSLSSQPRDAKPTGSESRPAANLSSNSSVASSSLAGRPSRWGAKLPSDIPVAQPVSGKAIKPAIAGHVANGPANDGKPRPEATARTPSVASVAPKPAQQRNSGSLTDDEQRLVQLLEKRGRIQMSQVKEEFKSQYGHDLSTPSGLKRYLLAIPGIHLVGKPPRQEAMYRASSKRGSVLTNSTVTAAAVPDQTTELSSTTKSTVTSASTSVRSLSPNEQKIVDLIVKKKRACMAKFKADFKSEYGFVFQYKESGLKKYLATIPGISFDGNDIIYRAPSGPKSRSGIRLDGPTSTQSTRQGDVLATLPSSTPRQYSATTVNESTRASGHVSHKNDGRDEFGRAVQSSTIPPDSEQLKTGSANGTTPNSSAAAATPSRTLSRDEQKLLTLLMKGRLALRKIYVAFKSEYGHNFHWQGEGSTLVSYLEALPGVLVSAGQGRDEVFISSPLKEKVSSLVSMAATSPEGDKNTTKANPEPLRRRPSWTPPKTSAATTAAGLPSSGTVIAQSHIAQKKNQRAVPVDAKSAEHSSAKSKTTRIPPSVAEPLCIDLTGDDSGSEMETLPPPPRKAVAPSAANPTETTKAVPAPSSKTSSYPKKIPSKSSSESPTDKLPLKRPVVKTKAKIPSPPASPIPQPRLRRGHRPRPGPFTSVNHIALLADSSRPTASCSLQTRLSCTMSYEAGYQRDGGGSVLQDEECAEIQERLSTWDPYYRIIEELGRYEVDSDPQLDGKARKTIVGTKTTPCQPTRRGTLITDHPNSCAQVTVDLPDSISKSARAKTDGAGRPATSGQPWGVKFGEHVARDRLKSKDRRLMVRTLPLVRTEKEREDRADIHRWPLYSFVQLDRRQSQEVVIRVEQRKQNQGDGKPGGLCRPLDLSQYVTNARSSFTFKIGAYQVIEKSGAPGQKPGRLSGSYAVHLSICEYVGADDLFEELMGRRTTGITLPQISLRSSTKIAKAYLAKELVCLDSDDEEGLQQPEVTCTKLSLLCPLTRMPIKTPVRGRDCKHLQCFDLLTYLHSNKTVTGSRWRCPVCNDFVAIRDLLHCGLTKEMVNKHGHEASIERDKIELKSTGEWRFLPENKLRYGSKSTKTEVTSLDGGEKEQADDDIICID